MILTTKALRLHAEQQGTVLTARTIEAGVEASRVIEYIEAEPTGTAADWMPLEIIPVFPGPAGFPKGKTVQNCATLLKSGPRALKREGEQSIDAHIQELKRLRQKSDKTMDMFWQLRKQYKEAGEKQQQHTTYTNYDILKSRFLKIFSSEERWAARGMISRTPR